MGNLATHLALCCHPVPGDRIIGYITRNRGVTIHRQDCYNIIREPEKERLLPAEWGVSDALYPVNIRIEAWDRVGLMRDITTLVAEAKVNISSVTLADHPDQTISIFLTMETKGLAQLSWLLRKIETIDGVKNLARIGNTVTDKTAAKGSQLLYSYSGFNYNIIRKLIR